MGPPPRIIKKLKIQAKSRNSEYFKLYHSIYNALALAGEKPSQNSHKYVLLRFGGEDHLKAAIALLVNKQSATFPLREKSGFSSPPPQLSLAGAASKKLKLQFLRKLRARTKWDSEDFQAATNSRRFSAKQGIKKEAAEATSLKNQI